MVDLAISGLTLTYHDFTLQWHCGSRGLGTTSPRVYELIICFSKTKCILKRKIVIRSIRSQFCTCYGISAIVTCKNVWANGISMGALLRIKKNRTKRIFTVFILWADEACVRWVPGGSVRKMASFWRVYLQKPISMLSFNTGWQQWYLVLATAFKCIYNHVACLFSGPIKCYHPPIWGGGCYLLILKRSYQSVIDTYGLGDSYTWDSE